MPYIEKKTVVPCPGGIPLKRIHDIKCRCGHGFKVDLGPEWKESLVIKCLKCGRVVAKSTEDLLMLVM